MILKHRELNVSLQGQTVLLRVLVHHLQKVETSVDGTPFCNRLRNDGRVLEMLEISQERSFPAADVSLDHDLQENHVFQIRAQLKPMGCKDNTSQRSNRYTQRHGLVFRLHHHSRKESVHAVILIDSIEAMSYLSFAIRKDLGDPRTNS